MKGLILTLLLVGSTAAFSENDNSVAVKYRIEAYDLKTVRSDNCKCGGWEYLDGHSDDNCTQTTNATNVLDAIEHFYKYCAEYCSSLTHASCGATFTYDHVLLDESFCKDARLIAEYPSSGQTSVLYSGCPAWIKN
ncbi:MAG: hypothetical protein V1647_03800 [Pseudomonadota bacterium]